jgi:hypothetical protein
METPQPKHGESKHRTAEASATVTTLLATFIESRTASGDQAESVRIGSNLRGADLNVPMSCLQRARERHL